MSQRIGFKGPKKLTAPVTHRGVSCAIFEETMMIERKRSLVKAWSKDDVKSLRIFARGKLSGLQAAKKLRRTPGAVAQKAMKLGIRFRSIKRKTH